MTTSPSILLHPTSEEGMVALAERHTDLTVNTGKKSAIRNTASTRRSLSKVAHVRHSLLVHVAIALNGKGIESEALNAVVSEGIALPAPGQSSRGARRVSTPSP